MQRRYFAVILLAVAPHLSAQTVYKCKGPDGAPIFTQERCGNDAEEHEVRVIAPSDDQIQHASQEAQARSALNRVSARENECVRRAQNAASANANNRIRHLQGRINYLEGQSRRANNNLAGATWQAGLREEIASLHQSISTERASADATVSRAVDRCARTREREEAALDNDG